MMRPIAAALLLVALGAAPASTTVRVQPSNISFKDSIAACPAGTLAAISLTMGHVRISEAEGADSDIDANNFNAQVVTLSKGGSTATATVNAAKDTVSAKHVTLASRNRAACVAPD